MSQDDNPPLTPPSPRTTPRFVPTLTEIVAEPATADGPLPAGNSLQPTEGMKFPEDAAVMELLARLGPELDARISETIAQVLHEQMPILNARLRQAVADVVRETVAGANLSQEPPDTSENP